MSRGVFVLGTGTDVGKTYVTALLVKALRESGRRAGYYKAAMSGNLRDPQGRLIPGDAQWVRQVSGIPQPLEEMCPYVYEAALSPHLAARLEGNPIDLERVAEGFEGVCRQADFVTVEGSGGVVCPLREEGGRLLLEDVVRRLGLPCVLVAHPGLGTINSVVLTWEYCRAHGLPLRGLIFNRFHPGDVMEEDNLLMCRALTGLPILARVEEGAEGLDLDPEALTELYAEPHTEREENLL